MGGDKKEAYRVATLGSQQARQNRILEAKRNFAFSADTHKTQTKIPARTSATVTREYQEPHGVVVIP